MFKSPPPSPILTFKNKTTIKENEVQSPSSASSADSNNSGYDSDADEQLVRIKVRRQGLRRATNTV